MGWCTHIHIPLHWCCQALGTCTIFTSQHCQGNVDGNSITQQQHGNRFALRYIFILLCFFFFKPLSLVIIVNDSSGMLSFPVTRIYKHWAFMSMGISTIIILASRKHEHLPALRHRSSNGLLMALIHSESALSGPCQGLKHGVSHTTPSQSPAPWGAAAGPTSPAEQGLHPTSCAPVRLYGKPQQ